MSNATLQYSLDAILIVLCWWRAHQNAALLTRVSRLIAIEYVAVGCVFVGSALAQYHGHGGAEWWLGAKSVLAVTFLTKCIRGQRVG